MIGPNVWMKAEFYQVFVVVVNKNQEIYGGYLEDYYDNAVWLKRVSICSWTPGEMDGASSLAVVGPTTNCHIGPMVENMMLFDIDCILPCTEDACERWIEMRHTTGNGW